MNSMTTLSCYTKSFTTLIGFLKLTDGGLPVDVTNSWTRNLSAMCDQEISRRELTFLNVTRADAGVYQCRVTRPQTDDVFYSQNMTLSVVNGVDHKWHR